MKDYRGSLVGEYDVGNVAYEHDYYSGSQVQVMMGDVLLDAAVGISYAVQQNKTPVYGYANQYYAFVADGQVFVQGSLTIAFKEAGYLLFPIKRFVELNAGSVWSPVRKGGHETALQDAHAIVTAEGSSTGQLEAISRVARRKQTMKANVEQVFAATNGSSTVSMSNKSPYNQLVTKLGALSDNEFEDWAEIFEDVLWYGSDKQIPTLRDQLNTKNLQPLNVIEKETFLSHRRPDQYPEVDIWIIYGDTSDHTANHTVKRLLDVSFTGCSTVISPSGEPVYENYSFIARNLV